MKYNDSSGDNEQRLERSRASIGQPPCSLGIPGTLSKRKLDIECVALRLRRGKDDSGLRGDREKSAMPNIWKTWNRVTGSRCIPRACILDPEVVRAISSNTEISRNHMTPEIELFLLTPNCDLYHAPFSSVLEADETKRRVFAEPFWSIYWPGGQALTRFILDHGKNIFSSSAKRVLDLGAGCGAAAIAAKLVGAETVVANDIDKGVARESVATYAREARGRHLRRGHAVRRGNRRPSDPLARESSGKRHSNFLGRSRKTRSHRTLENTDQPNRTILASGECSKRELWLP
ncbi:uncharacterized protein LOC143356259 isoform X2 [Halictus rubicundus]|uniref:uncharacterized protein LOC143356259 isoform X2 n=1 Tax=Halictus rubicundus TaxID=77578 RepID=UPI004036849D